MPPFAILLLLIGATLHTTWNLVIKGSSEKFVTTWWVVLIGYRQAGYGRRFMRAERSNCSTMTPCSRATFEIR